MQGKICLCIMKLYCELIFDCNLHIILSVVFMQNENQTVIKALETLVFSHVFLFLLYLNLQCSFYVKKLCYKLVNDHDNIDR